MHIFAYAQKAYLLSVTGRTDYALVGGAPEAYGSRRVCVYMCVCVCNSVPPISRRALKTKR